MTEKAASQSRAAIETTIPVQAQKTVATHSYVAPMTIKATVLNHRRKFNIFKSNKDYSVIVLCHKTQKQTELISSKSSLFLNLPMDSFITGFRNEKGYFFPQEIGINIVLKSTNQ